MSKKPAPVWQPSPGYVASIRDGELSAGIDDEGNWFARRGRMTTCLQPDEPESAWPYAGLARLCRIDCNVLREWAKRGIPTGGTDAAAQTT